MHWYTVKKCLLVDFVASTKMFCSLNTLIYLTKSFLGTNQHFIKSTKICLDQLKIFVCQIKKLVWIKQISFQSIKKWFSGTTKVVLQTNFILQMLTKYFSWFDQILFPVYNRLTFFLIQLNLCFFQLEFSKWWFFALIFKIDETIFEAIYAISNIIPLARVTQSHLVATLAI